MAEASRLEARRRGRGRQCKGQEREEPKRLGHWSHYAELPLRRVATTPGCNYAGLSEVGQPPEAALSEVVSNRDVAGATTLALHACDSEVADLEAYVALPDRRCRFVRHEDLAAALVERLIEIEEAFVVG